MGYLKDSLVEYETKIAAVQVRLELLVNLKGSVPGSLVAELDRLLGIALNIQDQITKEGAVK